MPEDLFHPYREMVRAAHRALDAHQQDMLGRLAPLGHECAQGLHDNVEALRVKEDAMPADLPADLQQAMTAYDVKQERRRKEAEARAAFDARCRVARQEIAAILDKHELSLDVDYDRRIHLATEQFCCCNEGNSTIECARKGF